MEQSILHSVKVVEVINEAASAKTFVLQPLNGWQPTYKAGQFITLLFNNNGTGKRRSYSLVPAEDGLLRITVKRVENGEYSRYMLTHVWPGHTFATTGITGFFTLPQEQPAGIKQLCFLAAGSGITPVFALISSALRTWQNVQVILIYSNRNKEDVIFKNELGLLQQQFQNRLHIEWLYSNSGNIYTARLGNYLLNIFLKKYIFSAREALFYMCGPFDYMLMIQVTLLIYGVPAEHIYKEQFSTLPRIVKPVPPDTAMHNAALYVNGNRHYLQVQYPATILEAAKARNIILPYSCEAGRCGSCAATCTQGKTWMAYNEVLTEEEVEKGRVLLCQAYPVDGDVVIEYDQ